MTEIYNQDINFRNWYYKEDFTHIFFYQKETLQWIKNKFEFSSLIIKDRLIKLKK